MALVLTACKDKSEPPAEPIAPEPAVGSQISDPAAGEKCVGISLPAQDPAHWVEDGVTMKKQLEALGYRVDLQYAQGNARTQLSQIQIMIDSGADCLIVAAEDPAVLTAAEVQAKEAGIPVVVYDRRLTQSDSVAYYGSFDHERVGRAIASYVEAKLDLANTSQVYTMELFVGASDDATARLLYDGVMKVMQKYLDCGVLVCKSGRTAFEDTLVESRETAQNRCAEDLAEFYTDRDLDICLTVSDDFTQGCRAALEDAGYAAGTDRWPVLTGHGAEMAAVRAIISGHQSMTVAKDFRTMPEDCSGMVHALLSEGNSAAEVRYCLGTPVAVDKENYREVLTASGYCTAEQLEG